MTTTAEYRAYLRSPEWDSRRREALYLAGYRCQQCGEAKPLQVHHLTYKRIFQEWQSDLIPLCFDCHEWIHAKWLKRTWIIAGKFLRQMIA